MKKTMSIILAVLMTAVLLAGCGDSTKLAEAFDEAEVKSAAETAITTFNSGDYDTFRTLVSDSLKAALTSEVLQNAVAQVMPNAGEFVQFVSESVYGQKDSEGNDNAVAVVLAEYENQKVAYTMSFDTDLLLTGFYIK